MTILRCLLFLLLGVLFTGSWGVQSTSAGNVENAAFIASQLEKRCASSFARYERLKDKDMLMEGVPPAWVGVTKDLNTELNLAIRTYNSAVSSGFSADDPNMKQAKETIEEIHEQMEKCGVWTSFRFEDSPLPDGATIKLDKIRSDAWEGSLLVKSGELDAASKAFQFARKQLQEIDRDIERGLDRGQKVEDYRSHPAYARTLDEVERFESSAKGALSELEEMRDKLNKDVEALANIADRCAPFFRTMGSHRTSGAEDDIITGIETFYEKIEDFESGTGVKAIQALKSFGDQYGADSEAIVKSVKRIMGDTPLKESRLPQLIFDNLTENLKEIGKTRKRLSEKLIRIAKENAATNVVDEARREECFARAKRSLTLAIKLDPANDDAKNLLGKLGGDADAATEKADAYLDSGTWGSHFSGFQGPGDEDDLAQSVLEWLSNDKGWSKDKDPIAVRINGDWRVAKKNRDGEPINWGLPIEAAFVRHKDRDSGRDAAQVFSLTIVTSEAEKAPPWMNARVGSTRDMRASNISTSGSTGPNFLFRLLLVAALLCSGFLLAGPGPEALAPAYKTLEPFRPIVGVASLAIGVLLFIFNLLSPFSDLLPQAVIIVAGLFLGIELLLKKPSRLATTEGEDVANKVGQNVDEAVQKTQDFLAQHEQSVRKIGKYQVPLGIACIVLGFLHLVAAGTIFF